MIGREVDVNIKNLDPAIPPLWAHFAFFPGVGLLR